jgi:epoxyqueuosine reductase
MSDALTHHVVGLAGRMGFDRVGVVSGDVAFPEQRYAQWLADHGHAGMAYMADHVELRHRPGKLVEDAKSVLCLAVSYGSNAAWTSDAGIAMFARGRDYHKVLKQRCHRLMDTIRETQPDFVGRAFVDSGPVLERRLAEMSGVGFRGRNGCLITEEYGSYVLLCEIVSNLPLVPTEAPPRTCQGCGQCAMACPTGALQLGGLVDANICRSYLTIEHRDAIDPALWDTMGDCVFGCDVCQSVCPHNQSAGMGDPELSAVSPGLLDISLDRILRWAEDDWDLATRGSTMRRTTHAMFLRNAAIAAGNVGSRDLLEALRALGASHPELAEIVAWATERIERRD